MSRSEETGELRRRAKERISKNLSRAPEPAAEDLRQLVHELQIHQAELEIQNEELGRVNRALEASNERFAEFYDFAPVGYFTFDRAGTILGANLRGASLLGADRTRLAGKRFGDKVVGRARRTFADFLRRAFSGNGPEACEVPLDVGEHHPLHVRIEAAASASGGECRAVVMDVTESRRAEDALRQAQRDERARTEDLAALLDTVPAVVWIAHDPEARHVTGNRQADEVLRLPRGAEASLTSPTQSPQNFKVFQDGRELQGNELPVQRAARGTVVSAVEVVIRFDDGTERHLLGNAVPLRDEQGRLRGAVAAFVDITERRRAEARANLLAQTASELLQTDSPQRVVDRLCANVMAFLACDVFFNFLADEKAGRLRLNAYSGVPEEEARRIEWLDYGVAVCGCAALDGRRIVAEDIGRTQDSRTDLVKSYGIQAYACHPLIAQGQVLGTLSFGTRSRTSFSEEELSLMRAVADQVAIAMGRKAIEKTLRENEERLRFHIENSRMAVIEWDRDLVVKRWAGEAERMFGWSATETLGRPIMGLELIDDEDVSQVEGVIARLTDGSTRHVMSSNRNYTKDRRVIYCEWYNSVLLDEDGHMSSVLSLVLDVTDRKQHEDELIQAREAAEIANKAKSDFLAMMSHEIRTPMNGIIGMIELALMETVNPKVREYLALSKTSAKHLLDIISDVLDLAKVEAGRVELVETNFDLREAVESVLTTLQALTRTKRLALDWGVDPRVPQIVRGDPGRLSQVLVNIVGNAIKFTERGGLRLSVSPAADREGSSPEKVRLLFSVADTGIGIPADRLDSIFESFSQIRTSHHARYGGTGLGLTIAKQIVELMGGRIWAESEIGVGSTFLFTAEFGVATGEAFPAGHFRSEESHKAERMGRLRILLAEDNPINQLFATTLLRDAGHEVVVAENGRQVLDTLSEETFDVILMDIQMPEMDGLEAARAVRSGKAGDANRKIPIVALTAHALKGDRERFLSAGMSDYLTKPIDLDEVHRILSELPGRNDSPAG